MASRVTRGRLLAASGALAISAAAAAVGLGSAAVATAAPSQTQTFHYHSIDGQLGAPTAPTTNVSNCPAPVVNDFTSISNSSGNGVSHLTINGNGAWGTSTFTGTVTVTFYPDGTIDPTTGNVTSVSGPPDMQVIGHLTNWDGFSGNRQNVVFHGTVNFQGVQDPSFAGNPNPGAPIRFHDVIHGAYLPGADQSGPPSFFFNVASC